MAISIEALMADPDLIDALDFPAQECVTCGVRIQESVTGKRYTTNKGCTCSGCFYQEMGAEIESHPIAVGRIRCG